MLLYTTDNAYHCVSDLLLMAILRRKASLNQKQNLESWGEFFEQVLSPIQSRCIEREGAYLAHTLPEQRPSFCISLMNIHRCWLPSLLCRSCGDNDSPATLPVIEGLWSSGYFHHVQKVAHNFNFWSTWTHPIFSKKMTLGVFSLPSPFFPFGIELMK